MIIYLIHLTLINSSIYLFTLYSHFCSNWSNQELLAISYLVYCASDVIIICCG
jgi:hypothetical protein